MTLNCSADGQDWQIWACAAVGIILQAGVLIFFGFLTKYRTLRFDKDGVPVESYAMPMAVTGTLALVLGILVCAHAVDESSEEEVYEVRGGSAAVAMVWLQKQKMVNDQHFDSVAIYPTMRRCRAYTSERMIDSDGNRETDASAGSSHHHDNPQSILDLRRHLGDLSQRQGPASEEALAVAKAIEMTMNFMMKNSNQTETETPFFWTVRVKHGWGQSGSDSTHVEKDIKLNVRYSPDNGSTVFADQIDAALSLWLYSMKERQNQAIQTPKFPSGNDHWIRGEPVQQQRCLHILGPSDAVLLRDLEWWMPKGLDDILAAREREGEDVNNQEPHSVRSERIGHCGEGWFKRERKDEQLATPTPMMAKRTDAPGDKLLYWDWMFAADLHSQQMNRIQREYENMDPNHVDQESDKGKREQSFKWLVTESQEPLQKLYAKELFDIAAQRRNSEAIIEMIENARRLDFNLDGILERSSFGAEALSLSLASAEELVQGLKALAPDILMRLIESRDGKGRTALLRVANLNRGDVFSYLVNNGADIRARSNSNQNVLHAWVWSAQKDGLKNMEKIKESFGLRVLKSMLKEKDNQGQTPLEEAKARGRMDYVELLERELANCIETETTQSRVNS
ncbi:hypothetical protein F66182_3738 [Fusarium sp. NRRL 66182]|nr:hypothetical protein F66182_3738 [Fusarium sp. NRRL 66182]